MLASVERLPPELLLQVFLFLLADASIAASWTRMAHRYGRRQRKDPRMVLTHVCHRWRSLCLNSPRLWCEVDAASEDWTREALARSRTLPLDVFVVEERRRPMRDSTRLVLEQLPRIRTLTFSHSNFTKGYDAQLPAAPLLDSLVLFSTIGALPRIGLALPRLTRLELRGCYGIAWDETHPIFAPSLLHLDVRNNAQDTEPRLPQLLRVLRRMPQLATLRLDNVLPLGRLSLTPARPDERAAFPALRSLTLGAPAKDAATFLYHVSLPPGASLSFALAEWAAPEIAGHFATALQQWLDGAPGATTSGAPPPLQVVHCTESRWRAWPSPDAAPDTAPKALAAQTRSGMPALDIAYADAIERVVYDTTHMPRALCALLAGRHAVTRLTLASAYAKPTSATWRELLADHPRVATLGAVGRAFHGLLPTLRVPADGELLAPALRTLILKGIDVCEDRIQLHVDALDAMLRERRQAGCAIE
ncbi:hypothetical protein PsYK624_073730 [Phanerochaete sordida]|uniref:F-box domain-containing protein n=1 Tax=Phanerochaete sordida TaxID=48140 RepID=A0A9P3LE39_9APHY|nr:hypothetical protein PsYK624_073730 [Phanerochaete sordida]